MKKKIISLFTVLCLMIPCFFAVACKDKSSEPKGIDAYTYSVTLKNAKGLIDENALQSEYDYDKQEDVSWTNTGNDYTISVTRNNTLSGDLAVSLLEGYDYTNLSFLVNEKEETGSVVSGSRENCEKEAYLTDRQFYYAYEEMKSDTSVVVDFSDCAWAKVSVDFSKLNSQGITAYNVANGFVSYSMATAESLLEVQDETALVDYGTIFAFDCGQKVVFKPTSSENFENLTYSKYASRYYLGNNMIQYFTAKKDGECQVYDASKDYSKRGTLRLLNGDGLVVYNSFDELKTNGLSMTPDTEKETYGGSMLKLGVVNGTRLYVKLSGDAQNYNYYLTDYIDDELSPTREVEQLVVGGEETVYLDINLTNSDGSPCSAKYLIRKPKNELNYFIVYADRFADNTRIANADYILVGLDNKPESASSHSGNIYYGFSKTSNGGDAKNVGVELSAFTSNTATDFIQTNINVRISTEIIYSIEPDDPEDVRTISSIFQEPLSSSIVEVDCFDESDGEAIYSVYVRYTPENFTEAEITLDASDFKLYSGEKVLYTTNLNDSDSWEVLTDESVLYISSAASRTIYYYVVSERSDAFLQIQNPDSEVVSITSVLRDCFGRPMTGTVNADGTVINLSNVRYLDIKPGSYSSYEAKLLREYDKEYHNITTSNIEANKVMISVNGYKTDGSSFKDIKSIDGLKIRYNGFDIAGSIYYYVNSDTNEHLVLKDSQGNIVSTSEIVKITNQSELLIDNKFVYCLSLNGGYYAEGEEFTIELVSAVYGLQFDLGGEIELFATGDVTGEPVDGMVLGQEYYFVGTDNKIFVIIDSETSAIVVDFARYADIDETTSVYKFTLTFPSNANYVDGTVFTLRVLDRQ